MLQKIREKVSGWVAGVILALLAFVFAVWGIDIGFNAQTYAAVVNGEEIPVAPVRRAIQNQMAQLQQAYGPDLPPGLQEQIRGQIIEGFVQNRLLVERVRELGYRISNESLTEEIRAMPVFQVGGQFSMDAYRAMLANAGYSPAGFEAEQRQNLEINQLQQGIFASAFVTPLEFQQRVSLEREQREVAWLVLPVDNYLGSVEISEDEIVAEYEDNADSYMKPETVDIDYIDIPLEQIAGNVTVSEQELRDFYDAEVSGNAELFVSAEQRRASHILINIDDDTSEEEALAFAQAARERVIAGEDFAAVARDASEDAGSAANGGDLDWIERGVMVAPFEEALFALDVGEISEPVKTPFGYHVIVLSDLRAGDTKSFDDVRADLESELRTRKAEDIFYNEAETLEQLSFESPDTLAVASEALGRPVQRVDDVTRIAGSGIASNQAVREAAFSEAVLANGENSPPLELEDGHAVVLRVAEHYPPSKIPLAEVRGRIASLLRREKTRDRLEAEAASIQARIIEGGDAEAIASGAGAIYEPPRLIGRDASDVPADVQQVAFASLPAAAGPAAERVELADGSYAIVLLSDVIPGQIGQLKPNEQRELSARFESEAGNAEVAGYVGQLRSGARVLISTEQFE
ncbi:MAG: SurA N-terminal domain-containing protein [Gammaproteobacteria bacterium]